MTSKGIKFGVLVSVKCGNPLMLAYFDGNDVWRYWWSKCLMYFNNDLLSLLHGRRMVSRCCKILLTSLPACYTV